MSYITVLLPDFLKEAEQIKKMEFAALRMNFTVETAKETEKLLNVFTDVYKKGKEVSDKNLSFTKGHFKRGVE